MTFEELQTKLQAVLVAVVQLRDPAFKPAWVTWADAPQGMHGNSGSLVLSFTSDHPEGVREADRKAGTKIKRSRAETHRLQLQVACRHTVQTKALDFAAMVRDGFMQDGIQESILQDTECVQSGNLGPLQYTYEQVDNRKVPVWIFEVPLRASIGYGAAAEETIGRIDSVEITLEVAGQAPEQLDPVVKG